MDRSWFLVFITGRLCAVILFSSGVKNKLKEILLYQIDKDLAIEKQCFLVLLTHQLSALPSATEKVELLNMKSGKNYKYHIIKPRLSTLLHTNLFYYLYYSDRIVFCNLVQIKKLGDKTH